MCCLLVKLGVNQCTKLGESVLCLMFMLQSVVLSKMVFVMSVAIIISSRVTEPQVVENRHSQST